MPEIWLKVKILIDANPMQKLFAKQRPLFDDLVKRNFIFTLTDDIDGDVAGLYDYGLVGATLKSNLIQKWKNHFIVEVDMLEISTACLTPQVVLKHSGHEDRFIDWMVKDEKTGDTFRADHLIEDFIGKKIEDKATSEEMRQELTILGTRIPDFKEAAHFDEVIAKYNITNPTIPKNQLSKTYAFNLMFECKIGPMGDQKGYLRPETAQSIFVNFKQLLELKNGKLPFGRATIGQAFRNEIAPRNSLLRVREFEMAEIEYFIDPLDKTHPKFKFVEDLELPLHSRDTQANAGEPLKMTLKEAVKQGVVANQMLGYFIGRTYLFALAIGLQKDSIRFRQHLKGEMAHYACDCWDLELLCSYGWVECVGLADRSAYDLTAHTKGSGEKLVASRHFEKPISKEILSYELDKAKIGKSFKKDAKVVVEAIEEKSQEQLEALKTELEQNGKAKVCNYEISADMFKSWKKEMKTIQEEKFTPSVIEPSFGIGRIIYCLLEQCFRSREDEKRTYFSFPPALAPFKVIFLPLMAKQPLIERVELLDYEFRKAGIMCKTDCGSSAIGKRYSRTDELGIPFAVTIDYVTLENDTVTLREINSMKQVRLPIKELKDVIKDFIENDRSFEDISKKYPLIDSSETNDE